MKINYPFLYLTILAIIINLLSLACLLWHLIMPISYRWIHEDTLMTLTPILFLSFLFIFFRGVFDENQLPF